jgi:predicted RNA binding protein YcfA (HicA-like mRNA interferase family)
MSKRKLLQRVLSGSANVRFADVLALAQALGFRVDRIRGSHHILIHPEIPRPLNLQKHKAQAKPYQVRQLLMLAEEYNLPLGDES